MTNETQAPETSEIIDIREEETTEISSPAATTLVAHPALEAIVTFGKNNFHTLAYSALGLTAAILFMVLGFWRALLIICLMGIGATIGRYQDGSHFLRKLLMRMLRKAS